MGTTAGKSSSCSRSTLKSGHAGAIRRTLSAVGGIGLCLCLPGKVAEERTTGRKCSRAMFQHIRTRRHGGTRSSVVIDVYLDIQNPELSRSMAKSPAGHLEVEWLRPADREKIVTSTMRSFSTTTVIRARPLRRLQGGRCPLHGPFRQPRRGCRHHAQGHRGRRNCSCNYECVLQKRLREFLATAKRVGQPATCTAE